MDEPVELTFEVDATELTPLMHARSAAVTGELHPEDVFVSCVLGALAKHGQVNGMLRSAATLAAQSVLDELEDGGPAHLDLDSLMGRALTLSMQAWMSRAERSRLVRALGAALRQHDAKFSVASLPRGRPNRTRPRRATDGSCAVAA